MDLMTLESVLLALLVVDAVSLTVLVLLQQGKGADVGAAFGSGSASTMFGSLGAASFFTKATAGLAIGFFVITFGLAYVAKERANAAGDLGIPTLNQGAPLTESGAETTDRLDNISDEVPGVDDFEGDVPNVQPIVDDAQETAEELLDDVPEESR
ncbi:MAG: preprotein translocase subunit SecG [Limisphaerales bacterium]|jgi:preprotein translocase subunit SecG